MHIYTNHIERIEKKYLVEGKQEPIEMPTIKDCSSATLNLVSKEFDIKFEESYFDKLDDYWKDYVLFSNKNNNNSIDSVSWNNKFSNRNMKLIGKNSIDN
jgi:hypothetical protein